MPRKTPGVTVSPAVLKWARETAGYSSEDAARRFHIPAERIATWETAPGPAHLTIRQLEELAHFYKRPTAALLLMEPPTQPPPPQDFRRPLHRDAPFSHDLQLAIRRGSRLRRLTRELLEAAGQPSVSEIPVAALNQDPEEVAAAQREAFGITVRDQREWRSPGEAFRRWRDSLELRRIPVFQASFPRAEAQGFSLPGTQPYAIVVTTKDAFPARCFTLFHEFAHLLLRQGGVCLTGEIPALNGDNLAQTEDWCHRFAEAFLVDKDALLGQVETGAVLRRDTGYQQELRSLASGFRVSQHVVLFRLRHLGLLPEQRFWVEYRRVQAEGEADMARQRERQQQSEGGPPPARLAVQERGRLFTRLVLDGLDRQILSYTQAIDYLDIRMKHLERVRQEAYA